MPVLSALMANIHALDIIDGKMRSVSIMTYAYVRVSTTEQNENRQMDSIAELKIPKERIYLDKLSGKNFDRPEWQKLVKKLKTGDVLYIKSIDRLGRDYLEIQNQWNTLKERGIKISVLDMPLLNTREGKSLVEMFVADMVLHVQSFFAQVERENLRQRQLEGIKSAIARGVKFGRPQKKLPNNFNAVVQRWETKQITFAQALAETNLKQSTFYKFLRQYRKER